MSDEPEAVRFVQAAVAENIRLEGLELYGVRVVGITGADISRTVDEVRGRLIHSMFGRIVMGRQQPYPMRWTAPANWWQHLKSDVYDRLPLWLWGPITKRWPVKTVQKSRDLEVKVLYPHVVVAKHPGLTPGVMTITVEDWPVGSVTTVPAESR